MSVVVIVLLCILLIIVIALFMSVTVSFSAGEALRVKVKYAGIPIFELSPEKKQKQKEKRRKTAASPKALAKQKKAKEKKKLKAAAKKEKKERQKKEKTKPKRSLYQTLELVRALVSSAGKPVKRLFSHIRITNVIADIVVSGEDAAEAALNYGKLNAVIHSLLQLLYSTVRLSVEKIDINVDFQSQKTKYFISFKLKLRLSTALGCALWYVFRAAKRMIAAKNEVGAEKTAAEKGK